MGRDLRLHLPPGLDARVFGTILLLAKEGETLFNLSWYTGSAAGF
jgi:hypothetical protein